jgi:hypothetical protein
MNHRSVSDVDFKVGRRRRREGSGEGAPPLPVSDQPMRYRQLERTVRYRAEIELGVRSAATKFRDNDQEASVATAIRLWWASRLRGPRFAQLIRRATDVTQARISLGTVQRGEAGRREAMPYFFEVLRDLARNERQTKRVENSR